jgi:predicted kinase
VNNTKLELLVGPIASGKSTYCRQAAKEGAIIVNDDSIVHAIHAHDYQLYEETLKPLYKSIENNIITMALTMGRRVVIDRPNHSIAMRRRYIGLAHSFDTPVRLVMFERYSPEVHGERRFKSDSRGNSLECWIAIAKTHDSLYETPNQEVEHFDEQVFWEFPGDEKE